MAKKDSNNDEKVAGATKQRGQMWYGFYIEPYFNDGNLKKLRECIVYFTSKDSSGVLRGTQKEQIQPDYFPIILPFLLSNERFDSFVQSYLNIGLHHRRSLNNAQNMIRTAITQLDILSYKDDTFFRPFVELAKIEQEIDGELDEKRENALQKRLEECACRVEFKDFENVAQILEKSLPESQYDRILSQKSLLEAKFSASHSIAKIRLINYGKKRANSKEAKEELQKQAEGNYKEISRLADSAIQSLVELESFDYDCAMLAITLQGHKFLGARVHFLDTPKHLQTQYQEAFLILDSLLRQDDKSNERQDDRIDDKQSEEMKESQGTTQRVMQKAMINKLKPFCNHPHIKAYLQYYHFLYIQRKMELAAQAKNLRDFKHYVQECAALLQALLISHLPYLYLLTKIKKHYASIMNILWHIELREIAKQLETPFHIEASENANNKGAYDILRKENKFYTYIESMLN